MKKYIKFKEISRWKIEVIFIINNKYLGKILFGEDGDYSFYPENEPGSWPSYALREICDKLDELNKENDKIN